MFPLIMSLLANACLLGGINLVTAARSLVYFQFSKYCRLEAIDGRDWLS